MVMKNDEVDIGMEGWMDVAGYNHVCVRVCCVVSDLVVGSYLASPATKRWPGWGVFPPPQKCGIVSPSLILIFWLIAFLGVGQLSGC
jgi:hypothetical protein